MKLIKILTVLLVTLNAFRSQAQLPAWERLNPFPQSNSMHDIIRISGTNRLIAAGMGSTIMMSDDIGVTWQYILFPAGLGSDFIGNKFTFINETTGFLAGNKNRIIKTTDSGSNWRVVYSDSSGYSDFIIEVEFINDSVGYAIGREGFLLKTTDQGESWTVSDIGYQPYTLTEIEFLNQSVGFINSGINGEILKTIDGGITWTVIQLLSGWLENSSIRGIEFIDQSTGFLSVVSSNGGSGIYKSTDSGISWYQVSEIEDWYGRRCFFIDSSNGIFTYSDLGGGYRVYITADAGESWDMVEQATEMGVQAIGFCYYDESILFSTGTIGSMYKSENGGLHWELYSHNKIDGYIGGAVVFDRNNGILLTQHLYDYSSILKTTDGFESFENLLTVPSSATRINFPDPDHGFCFYKDYPYTINCRTNDGGITWITDTISNNSWLTVQETDFLNFQKGIILCDNRYFITLDGGNFWEEKFINEDNQYNTIDWVTENKLVISGISQDTSVLLISEDMGITWQTIEIPFNEEVSFTDENTAFLFSNSQLLKTTDGGYNWYECEVNSGSFNEFRDISFPTQDTGYLVGWAYHDNVLKSIDGGETWNSINAPVTSAFNHIKFTDAESGYIFNLNDIFKTTTGGIVGIKSPQVNSGNNFLLYPNPFKDEIRMDFNSLNQNDQLEMRIFNVEGVNIHNTNINSNAAFVIFNGSSLKPGVYLFQFIKDGVVLETRKMVKL